MALTRAWPRLAVILLGACAALAQAADDAAATNGRERVRAFLDRVTGMQASFEQQVRTRDGAVTETAAGRFVMQRPGRFRWDYASPYTREIVADGVRIWIYEADLEQVTVRRLSDGIGDTPAGLLTGTVDILDRFDATGVRRDGGLEWVSLVPRAADSDFALVELGFAGSQLAALELEDRLGQITAIRFADIVLNPAVSDRAFEFRVPPGADVIGEGEL